MRRAAGDSPWQYYSEVHHIRPLGGVHAGADVPANMLCVCPNHHTLLDFFAIPLDPGAFKVKLKHPLDSASVAYHNAQVGKLP